ncbi:hypothetical protein [Mycobacterium sp. ITM-2016-00318]|nr:hypothetical protein [Mycobacterium sp. ITM-2016-00318]WNG91038.1 hypothetical protein C6A82_016050 [Mycobacterium sp. ITM-2016-00318]
MLRATLVGPVKAHCEQSPGAAAAGAAAAAKDPAAAIAIAAKVDFVQ